MTIASGRTIVSLLVFLLVCAAVLWLQIYLSRRPERFPGLLLPILSFAVSLIVAFGILSMRLELLSPREGVVVAGQVPSWGNILLTFALYNVPTVVLLLIYAVCRWRKHGVQSQMDKMRIDDLE